MEVHRGRKEERQGFARSWREPLHSALELFLVIWTAKLQRRFLDTRKCFPLLSLQMILANLRAIKTCQHNLNPLPDHALVVSPCRRGRRGFSLTISSFLLNDFLGWNSAVTLLLPCSHLNHYLPASKDCIMRQYTESLNGMYIYLWNCLVFLFH